MTTPTELGKTITHPDGMKPNGDVKSWFITDNRFGNRPTINLAQIIEREKRPAPLVSA